MTSKRTRQIEAKDRSMAGTGRDGGELFFFPKAKRPTSVRAASREEAERLLETSNQQEND